MHEFDSPGFATALAQRFWRPSTLCVIGAGLLAADPLRWLVCAWTGAAFHPLPAAAAAGAGLLALALALKWRARRRRHAAERVVLHAASLPGREREVIARRRNH